MKFPVEMLSLIQEISEEVDIPFSEIVRQSVSNFLAEKGVVGHVDIAAGVFVKPKRKRGSGNKAGMPHRGIAKKLAITNQEFEMT